MHVRGWPGGRTSYGWIAVVVALPLLATVVMGVAMSGTPALLPVAVALVAGLLLVQFGDRPVQLSLTIRGSQVSLHGLPLRGARLEGTWWLRDDDDHLWRLDAPPEVLVQLGAALAASRGVATARDGVVAPELAALVNQVREPE
ncbi:MAG: hypothetical protein R3F59_28880 [Myxococcota bacterium]